MKEHTDSCDLASLTLLLLQPPTIRYAQHLSQNQGQFPPEQEQGNVEYKQKLDPNPLRFQHLLSQMKWRLSEVGLCFYLVGVQDCGKICPGNSEESLRQSISVLEQLAQEAQARIFSCRIIREDEIGKCKVFAQDEIDKCKVFAEICISKSGNLDSILWKKPQISVCFVGPLQSGKTTLISCLAKEEIRNFHDSLNEQKEDSFGLESCEMQCSAVASHRKMLLFKHRHEILTGITSSISYQHQRQENANFFHLRAIDTPGNMKYRKTLFKCLTTHQIHAFVVAFDASDSGMSESFAFYHQIAQAFEVPMALALCKTDLLSAKTIASHLHDLMQRNSHEFGIKFEIMQKAFKEHDVGHWKNVIPIVLVSCESGEGSEIVGELLLNSSFISAPLCHSMNNKNNKKEKKSCRFLVQQILKSNDSQCILYGQMIRGSLDLNEETQFAIVASSESKDSPSSPSHHPIKPISLMIDREVVNCIPETLCGSILFEISSSSCSTMSLPQVGMMILPFNAGIVCGKCKKFDKFTVKVHVFPGEKLENCDYLMVKGQLLECQILQSNEFVEFIDIFLPNHRVFTRPEDVVILFRGNNASNPVGIARVVKLKC